MNQQDNVKVHEMKLQEDPFNSIKEGTKTVEMRLNDEKRQLLKIKDIIIFKNNVTNEKIECVIEDLLKFKDFETLYDHFDKVSIGYKESDVPNPDDMSQYYDKENIDKYGTLAIKIKKSRRNYEK